MPSKRWRAPRSIFPGREVSDAGIYRFIDDAIEADRQRYTDIADQIWDHPETRFEEFWSAEHLASALESAASPLPAT